MTPREKMIAHMPPDAQTIMRGLFDQIDRADRDLGLAPPLPSEDGLSIKAAWHRRAPRDGIEYSERMRERELALKPILQHINYVACMFPAPIFVFSPPPDTGG